MEQFIKETHFQFPGQTGRYQGKVRDVYFFNGLMAMVATDRISAFDVILPRAIPDKGRVLNMIAARNLGQTRDIVPNWVMEVPDDNVTVGKRCEPFSVEMVVRNYVSGHAWRVYRSGKRELCGVPLPDGLKEHDRLPHPIITPSTKAKEGHDEDISRDEIIATSLVGRADYEKMEEYALKLFDRGTGIAASRNLILVDTKYEFGKLDDIIILIDEVHTPDSSRYFYAHEYALLQQEGKPQKQLSKEFVREWLIENGFQGKQGQQVPTMTDAVVESISDRYKELYRQFIGEELPALSSGSAEERIEQSILNCLNRLNFGSTHVTDRT